MLSEPMTLYKLMILYMLKQVNFPLTSAQLSNFFLEHEYTTYFTLNQALSELLEAKLLYVESNHNSSRYEDMDGYLKENKFRLRNEVGVTANYYKSTNHDYIVHCEVREGKSCLINLELSVPDKDQAEIMCDHWKSKSQEIYAFAMKALMSGS